MSTQPVISVIIPARNAAEYLEESVVSVLQQSYQGFEIIIVNHNSTDGTVIVANRLAKLDRRIKVYTLESDGTAAQSRNYGIRQASCEYIAFLDADDIWYKEKLWHQIEYYAERPDAAFIYSASLTFGSVSYFSPLYEVLPLPWKAARSHDDLLRGNSVTCSSVLTRKSLLEEVGLFDENPENKSEDYDLWLKLTKIAPPVFLPEILVDYRIHPRQFTAKDNTRADRLEYIRSKWGITAVYHASYRGNPFLNTIRNLAHHFAVFLYKAGIVSYK
ncbi:MAG: hypothetical protein AMXMBFR48_10190 [Ignavibacteriales bacterium]